MKRFSSILFQIDEAAKYIVDGRLEHLRLALLLLDNSIEMQMYFKIIDELNHEDIKNALRQKILELKITDIPTTLEEIMQWQPIGINKKAKIYRFFDEKIKYLCTDLKILDTVIGDVISYLHKYRNEAYHNIKVRKKTILTAAKLLLEINLDMLKLFPLNGIYDSDEDYSWLMDKFKYDKPIGLYSREIRNNFIKRIRKIVPLLDSDISQNLSSHLEGRLDDLTDNLDFILKTVKTCKNRNDAIKFSNYIKSAEKGEFKIEEMRFEDFNSEISIKNVKSIIDNLPVLKNFSNKMEAFKHFSQLELELEEVENPVSSLVSDIDNHIELQIDMQRGK